MIIYKQGEIILVPFPYSEDLSQSKPRPVLVVSNTHLVVNEVICVQITSNVSRNEPNDVYLSENDALPPLPKKSVVRTHIVHSIDKSMILKRIAQINEDKLVRVLENLHIILEKD